MRNLLFHEYEEKLKEASGLRSRFNIEVSKSDISVEGEISHIRVYVTLRSSGDRNCMSPELKIGVSPGLPTDFILAVAYVDEMRDVLSDAARLHSMLMEYRVWWNETPCDHCSGRGVSGARECDTCKGKGVRTAGEDDEEADV